MGLYEYRAIVLRVIDGDTIRVRVDKGFDDNGQGMRLRLLGVDCPEKKDREAWTRAKLFTAGWIDQHSDSKGRIYIKTSVDEALEIDDEDSFGRYLAEVWDLVDGEHRGEHYLNADLLASNNAVVYQD